MTWLVALAVLALAPGAAGADPGAERLREMPLADLPASFVLPGHNHSSEPWLHGAPDGGAPPDLMDLTMCASKGRFQDLRYNPHPELAARLLAMGREAVPFLISRLESERLYQTSPICFWSDVREGDMALLILTDLFTDGSWVLASHPRVCMAASLGPDFDPGKPLSQELPRLVAAHGRSSIVANWIAFWAEHGDDVVWDEAGRFFRVEGVEPMACDVVP